MEDLLQSIPHPNAGDEAATAMCTKASFEEGFWV